MAAEILRSLGSTPMPDQVRPVPHLKLVTNEQAVPPKTTLKDVEDQFGVEIINIATAAIHRNEEKEFGWVHIGEEGPLYAGEQLRERFANAGESYRVRAEGISAESAVPGKATPYALRREVDLITGHMEGLNGSTVDAVRSLYGRVRPGGALRLSFPNEDDGLGEVKEYAQTFEERKVYIKKDEERGVTTIALEKAEEKKNDDKVIFTSNSDEWMSLLRYRHFVRE